MKVEKLEIQRFCGNIEIIAYRINIPYSYLPKATRCNMAAVVKNTIIPAVHDQIRRGNSSKIFGKDFATVKEELGPDNISPSEFIRLARQAYADKIEVQTEIADLITRFKSRKVTRGDFVKRGIDLLKKSESVEPRFFAVGAQMKTHIDLCVQEARSHHPGMGYDEQNLLLSPGFPPTYLTFETDIAEYLLSDEVARNRLLHKLAKKYFNDDLEFALNQLSIISSTYSGGLLTEAEIATIRQEMESVRIRKIYFLLERHIRYAEELDILLTMDNCLDKYFEKKLCFLHDLFLKIFLLGIAKERIPINLTPENIDSFVREAMEISTKDLIKLFTASPT